MLVDLPVALNDFSIFKELFDYDLDKIDEALGVNGLALLKNYKNVNEHSKMFNKRIRDRICETSRRLAAAADEHTFMDIMTAFYKDFGVGKLGLHKAFRVEHTEEGAEIVDSILMPGTVVRRGARVQYAILAENTEIGANARVGESPEECADLTHWGVAVVASGIRVGAGAVVQAKAMVESDIPENGEVSIHA